MRNNSIWAILFVPMLLLAIEYAKAFINHRYNDYSYRRNQPNLGCSQQNEQYYLTDMLNNSKYER